MMISSSASCQECSSLFAATRTESRVSTLKRSAISSTSVLMTCLPAVFPEDNSLRPLRGA